MFTEIRKEAIEGIVREHGPVEAMRQVLNAICIVRHDVDADAHWAYNDAVEELSTAIRSLSNLRALTVGANRRAA